MKGGVVSILKSKFRVDRCGVYTNRICVINGMGTQLKLSLS
jgi:hypothetical protein